MKNENMKDMVLSSVIEGISNRSLFFYDWVNQIWVAQKQKKIHKWKQGSFGVLNWCLSVIHYNHRKFQ